MTVTWESTTLWKDEEAMKRAHAEYRESTLDCRPLSALDTTTFRAILKRAQEIKATL